MPGLNVGLAALLWLWPTIASMDSCCGEQAGTGSSAAGADLLPFSFPGQGVITLEIILGIGGTEARH